MLPIHHHSLTRALTLGQLAHEELTRHHGELTRRSLLDSCDDGSSADPFERSDSSSSSTGDEADIETPDAVAPGVDTAQVDPCLILARIMVGSGRIGRSSGAGDGLPFPDTPYEHREMQVLIDLGIAAPLIRGIDRHFKELSSNRTYAYCVMLSNAVQRPRAQGASAFESACGLREFVDGFSYVDDDGTGWTLDSILSRFLESLTTDERKSGFWSRGQILRMVFRLGLMTGGFTCAVCANRTLNSPNLLPILLVVSLL